MLKAFSPRLLSYPYARFARWTPTFNYDSEFQTENDKLNRLRHYFWNIDERGEVELSAK